jgi:hypothetical protein
MKKIPLTHDLFAIVDDYEFLSQFKWYAIIKTHHTYAAYNKETNDGSRCVYMHRVIAGDCENKDIDHINGNSLDNRRDNLRICTHAENLRNRRRQKNNNSAGL